MASYKDYMNGKIPVTKENLSKAVSSMSAAANKRLKRMQEQGLRFADGSERSESEDSIAGTRKFGAKGKTEQELQSEYKRLVNFFESDVSSVTGVKKQAEEFGIAATELYDYIQAQRKRAIPSKSDEYVEYEKPLTKREQKDFDQARRAEETRAERLGKTLDDVESKREWYREWLDSVNLYKAIISSGRYKPSQHDSDQMRDIAQGVVADFGDTLSMDEMVEIAMQRFNKYGRPEMQPKRSGRSTSDFFAGSNI